MDCELVEQARRGDTASYGNLVRRHQTVAYRAAYLMTGNAAEAEEVMQEAFLKAYRALETFRPGSAFRPWLLRIVTNEALQRRRSNQRRVRLERRVFDLSSANHWSPSPESETLSNELFDEIATSLAGLKDMDRIVLTYRYLLDMPVKDIAAVLGSNESTIRTRISRALDRLRQQMTVQVEESHRD